MMRDIAGHIKSLCLDHYPRVAEISTGLSLIGLSSYVIDVRIEQLGFALAPYRVAVVVCALILFVTGVGQIAVVVGFGSFWQDRWRHRRAETWMQFGFRQERVWRSVFALLASFEWGCYAGALSGTRIASCFVGGGFILLMTASFVRLGANNEWQSIPRHS
jgi:hypothetical protein